MEDKKAILVLEDGIYFTGKSFGAKEEAAGPVISNTAVVGYQEIITDSGNAGKILNLTYPLIGNYGINEKFNESQKPWIKGLVIKEASSIYSNWQAKASLDEFMQRQKVAAITGIDTRTLAVKLRNDGEVWGIISSKDTDIQELLKRLNELKRKKNESILPSLSVRKNTCFKGKKQRIAVIDLGVLKSILRQLQDFGFEVTLVPYHASAKEILKLKPEGVIISGGPEDDPELVKVIETTKEILGKIPILGIATGHQVIAQAQGAKVTRMKIGHHGLNYPVKGKDSLKGEITVQNHSFVVDEDSLNHKEIEVTERNLNDQSIEKMRSEKFKFISLQYYPVSPGLGEVHPVFNEFANLLGR